MGRLKKQMFLRHSVVSVSSSGLRESVGFPSSITTRRRRLALPTSLEPEKGLPPLQTLLVTTRRVRAPPPAQCKALRLAIVVRPSSFLTEARGSVVRVGGLLPAQTPFMSRVSSPRRRERRQRNREDRVPRWLITLGVPEFLVIVAIIVVVYGLRKLMRH